MPYRHRKRETHTTDDEDRLVVASLDLADLNGALPDLLSVLVLQEEFALIIHELLDGVLVNGGFTTLGRSSDDLEILVENVVWMGSFGEVPSNWLWFVSHLIHEALVEYGPLTLPSRVLSADERMNRIDPLDIVYCLGVV